MAADQSETLGRRVARGGIALVLRQVFTQGLTLVGGLVLLRFLAPEDLAVYAVISILRDWYGQLVDLGLSATLIQQEQPVSRDQQRSFWSLQTLISLAAAGMFALLDPLLRVAFGWNDRFAGVLALVGAGLVLVPLRSVPVVLLQRQLALERFAIIEASESVVFIGVAIGAAVLGLGGWAIAWGVVARFAAGALVASLLYRWPIGWRKPWSTGLDWKLGFAFQSGVWLTLLKESTLPLLLGLLLLPQQVGYLKWAMTLANLPMVLPIALDRLVFPLMSRVRDQPGQLRLWTIRALQLNSAITWWLGPLLAVLAQPLVTTLLGQQWQPALPYLWGLLPAAFFYAPLVALIQAFMALGRPQLNFWLNLGWLVLLWPLVPLLVPSFGPLGFVLANFAIQSVSVAVIRVGARELGINVFAESWPPMLAAGVASAVGLSLSLVWPGGAFFKLALVGVAMSAVYAGVLWLTWRSVLQKAFAALRTRSAEPESA